MVNKSFVNLSNKIHKLADNISVKPSMEINPRTKPDDIFSFVFKC